MRSGGACVDETFLKPGLSPDSDRRIAEKRQAPKLDWDYRHLLVGVAGLEPATR